MDLMLNRKSQLSINVQLKAQLIYLIQAGQLLPGTQLPTVRQMAGYLRVNRNTVSKVFSEMEREGYLSCEPGRGTFVSKQKVEAKMSVEKMQELMILIDEAIEKARQLGFSPSEFSLTLYARTQIDAEPVKTPKIPALFVECNRAQLELFSAELKEALPLQLDSVLIKELERLIRQTPESVRKYALVVTTFNHVHEVQTLLENVGIEVVGLLAEANLETLMRLTELPEGTKVGVVCDEWTGTENMKLSIQNAGLKHIRLIAGCGQDKGSLKKIFKDASVVVCSKTVEKRIRSMVRQGIEVIVDHRRLDQAGIEMLRRRLETSFGKDNQWRKAKI